MDVIRLFSKGTKDIGPFRLHILNDLLADEAEALENAQSRQAETLFMALSLAREIAEAQSTPEQPVTPEQVLEQLQGGNLETVEGSLNLASHAAEIALVLRESKSPTSIAKPLVATMIRFRARLISDPDADLSTFSEYDAGHLPLTLLNELYGFLQVERSGGEKAHAAQEKQIAGKAKRSTTKPASTGAPKSSAESPQTGGSSTSESKQQE